MARKVYEVLEEVSTKWHSKFTKDSKKFRMEVSDKKPIKVSKKFTAWHVNFSKF